MGDTDAKIIGATPLSNLERRRVQSSHRLDIQAVMGHHIDAIRGRLIDS